MKLKKVLVDMIILVGAGIGTVVFVALFLIAINESLLPERLKTISRIALAAVTVVVVYLGLINYRKKRKKVHEQVFDYLFEIKSNYLEPFKNDCKSRNFYVIQFLNLSYLFSAILGVAKTVMGLYLFLVIVTIQLNEILDAQISLKIVEGIGTLMYTYFLCMIIINLLWLAITKKYKEYGNKIGYFFILYVIGMTIGIFNSDKYEAVKNVSIIQLPVFKIIVFLIVCTLLIKLVIWLFWKRIERMSQLSTQQICSLKSPEELSLVANFQSGWDRFFHISSITEEISGDYSDQKVVTKQQNSRVQQKKLNHYTKVMVHVRYSFIKRSILINNVLQHPLQEQDS